MTPPRLRRTIDHPLVKHGTYVTYMNYKCRCDSCVADYKRYRAEYRDRNRDKIAKQQREYYESNHERLNAIARARAKTDEYRMHRRAMRFGISVEQLIDLLSAGKCAICESDQPGPQGWHIDHDHSCCEGGNRNICGKCIRGILCHKCNIGIGHFDDDPERMRLAIEYLNRGLRS